MCLDPDDAQKLLGHDPADHSHKSSEESPLKELERCDTSDSGTCVDEGGGGGSGASSMDRQPAKDLSSPPSPSLRIADHNPNPRASKSLSPMIEVKAPEDEESRPADEAVGNGEAGELLPSSATEDDDGSADASRAAAALLDNGGEAATPIRVVGVLEDVPEDGEGGSDHEEEEDDSRGSSKKREQAARLVPNPGGQKTVVASDGKKQSMFRFVPFVIYLVQVYRCNMATFHFVPSPLPGQLVDTR